MPDISAVKNAPEISFIDDRSIDDVRSEMIADYEQFMEQATGQKMSLDRASPHRMELNAAASQIFQAMQYIDRAGKLNLLKYSYSTYLDNLALLRGTTRLPAAVASATFRFTLSAVRQSATGIPKGTRVAGPNNVYFATVDYVEIPAGQMSVDVTAACVEEGKAGNSFEIGELSTIVDLIPYVASVENITMTEGGTDVESDADLAERTHLAPSAYSTAGPAGGYEYWVRTYRADIGDVKITSNQQAGTVDIHFLMEDGSDPSKEMVAGLLDYLKTGDMRPMGDRVTASAPEAVPYAIEFRYWINRTDTPRAVTIQTAVAAAVEQYISWQRKIGRDINPDELTTAVKMAGAKRLVIKSPVYTPVGKNKAAALHQPPVIEYGGLEDD